MSDRPEFFLWVATRRAHNNPRGDFIRDTRAGLEQGVDCAADINRGCDAARREYRRLLREWEKCGRPTI